MGVVVAGCGDNDDGGTVPDTTPPAAVSDLSIALVTHTSVILAWEAPGDDGTTGRASAYDIRWSVEPITAGDWAGATQAADPSRPRLAGSSEAFIIEGLTPATVYYFALKAEDEAHHWSDLSNVASDTTTDPTQPAVPQFTATPLAQTIELRWQNPSNAGFEGVLIRYSDVESPADPSSGLEVPDGNAGRFPGNPAATDSFPASELDPATTYYFSAFAYNHDQVYSSPICASATTPFLPRTSPENLLRNLKLAYEKRNVAEYESLLAVDFTFVLSVEDAGQPGMPSQWGRNTEIAVHWHMLDTDLVTYLALDFVVGGRVFDDIAQLWTVTITHVDLELTGMTPDHPISKSYSVRNGTSKFWFRQNDWTAPGTSDRTWSIVKWEDSPLYSRGAPGAAEPANWGTVKSVYR